MELVVSCNACANITHRHNSYEWHQKLTAKYNKHKSREREKKKTNQQILDVRQRGSSLILRLDASMRPTPNWHMKIIASYVFFFCIPHNQRVDKSEWRRPKIDGAMEKMTAQLRVTSKNATNKEAVCKHTSHTHTNIAWRNSKTKGNTNYRRNKCDKRCCWDETT